MSRQFVLAGCAICLLLSVFALPSLSHAADRPNFLVILADDLGYSDLGCYGGEIETPHLDGLAADGLRFTQFYNTARCWPTRVAILSGYYPQQVGRDALPNLPGGARGKRPEWAILLPKMLGPLGYRSYLSGKWHVDGTPIQEGLDHSLTMDDHNRFFYPQKTTLDDVKQPPVERGTDYYQTTAIASHAINCLKEHQQQHSDQPFFQYLAFTCPHFPLHAPEEDIAKYRGRFDEGWDVIRQRRWRRIQEMGLVSGTLPPLEITIGPPYRKHSDPAMEKLGPKEVDAEIPWVDLAPEQKEFQAQKMEVHAAMVDRMDQEIGRVIDQIRQMGQLDNTLVLFLSDNGASAEIMIRGDGHLDSVPPGSADSYLCLGPGWSRAANTPFRRHKTWVHEGGAATPMIAFWPDGIKERGDLSRRVSHVIDIAPTLVELAGGVWPVNQEFPQPPGKSFAAEFDDDKSDDPEARTLWWLHEGNKAIRKGNMKLVAAEGEPWQLYDLKTDRAESYDLSKQLPDQARALEKEWNEMTASFEELAKERMEANRKPERAQSVK